MTGTKEIAQQVFGRRYSDLETKGGVIKKSGKTETYKKMKREDYFRDLMELIRKARGRADDAA